MAALFDFLDKYSRIGVLLILLLMNSSIPHNLEGPENTPVPGSAERKKSDVAEQSGEVVIRKGQCLAYINDILNQKTPDIDTEKQQQAKTLAAKLDLFLQKPILPGEEGEFEQRCNDYLEQILQLDKTLYLAYFDIVSLAVAKAYGEDLLIH